MLIAILAAFAVQLTRPVADTAGPTQLGGAVIVVLGAVATLTTVRHRPGRRPVGAVVGRDGTLVFDRTIAKAA